MQKETYKSPAEIGRALRRHEVEQILALREEPDVLAGFDLRGLNMVGLDLSNRTFKDARVGSVQLHPEEIPEGGIEKRTNIRNSDWTDAVMESDGVYTLFTGVDAADSRFGFTESLYERNKRHETQKQKGVNVPSSDSGSYLGFDGSHGRFQRTRWKNIDFVGTTEFSAIFFNADLQDAVFEDCDLRGVVFKDSHIDRIKIRLSDPQSLEGVQINASQVHEFVRGIEFVDEACADGFTARCESGEDIEDVLWNFLGVEVV